MSDANGPRARGASFSPILLVLMGVAIAAGFAWWAKHLQPGAAPQAPIPSTVQGTSFDVPARTGAKEVPAPAVEPATLELAALPPAEPKPVAPPAPLPAVAEPKPAAKTADPPAPASAGATAGQPQVKPAPAPVVPPVETPAAGKPAEPKTAQAKPAQATPTDAKPAGAAAADAKPAPADDKPASIDFAKLAFRYWPQPKDVKDARDPFPAKIRAMNGQKVTIDGYMFPIDFEKGKVRSFLLSRGMFGCCYGDSPQITEVIKVVRTDGKVMPFEAMARVTGTLEVGEEFDGEGYVDSVYRIKAEAVGPAPASK
jgi:hypothetical protein